MVRDWLKLLYLKGISPGQKRALVKHCGSPGRVFTTPPSELTRVEGMDYKGMDALVKFNGLKGPISDPSISETSISETSMDLQCQRLLEMEISYVGFTEPEFPFLLNQISSPPLGLFVKGNIELLQTPQIAMVGSRNPSPSGRRTTIAFARRLSEQGMTITSGMACGIDSNAHEGALEFMGNTIAVVGTGLDVVYPRSNRQLFEEIAYRGLVVSEYPLGTSPRKQHFPQRNRIISGLSLGTLVMEAGMRSGSLITARLATEQGREVFAVPGSIHSPTSRGCHHLIRQGAKLVETTADVTDEIKQYFSPLELDEAQNREGSMRRMAHRVTQEVTSEATRNMGVSPPTPAISISPKTLTKIETPEGEEITSYNPQWETDLLRLIDYTPVAFDQLVERSGLTVDEISSILVNLELRGLITETISGYQRLPNCLPG